MVYLYSCSGITGIIFSFYLSLVSICFFHSFILFSLVNISYSVYENS